MMLRAGLWAVGMAMAAGLSAGALGCSNGGETGGGGSGGDGGGNVESAASYYRDVKPILDSKCVGCHSEGGIGPFSLASYEAAKPMVGLIKDEVSSGAMPPWPPNKDCNEYWGDRSLSDEQIATVVKWIDEGAVEGDPKDEGKVPASAEQVKLSRVDLTLSAPEKYVQKDEPDDYRCFVIDWPYSDVKYVSGFRANPGDARVVHHVIAFLVAPKDVPQVEAMDAAEEGPGYTCFGGSGINSNEWLGAWAPGSLGSDFPAGTGVRVEPGSKIALQVHYNSLTAGPQPDQTSIDFKIEDKVEKEGRIQPWTKVAWLSGQSMMIPAGDTDVMHSFEYDPTVVLTAGKSFTMYSASLHMHQLGTSGKMAIHRAGGGEECLLQIDDWNFHWQGSYGFKQPVVFNPGDKLYLECHWDNSAGNQTGAPKDTWWGEGTGDEMCLGGFYLTE
ncbi:MAG: monooxygenase [Polyangiaceae bacterium]